MLKHDECDELKSGLYAGEFKDEIYYKDFPTQCVDTDIYEMQNGVSFAYFDIVDEDGEETAFKEVVNFYQDQNSKQFLTKNCEVRIKHYLDDENETFEYIGDPFIINLEQYINKENIKKEMYFTPKNK